MSAPLRLLVDPAGTRFHNMALDEALLRLNTAPVLRCYRWAEADAVSIGYFQPHADVPGGRPFVRRYTGGGLVDHAADFTYTVILPKTHPLSIAGTSASYAAIHEKLADALKLHGIDAYLAPVADPNLHAACFQRAVKYDIVDSAGHKLAGAAQRRSREGSLHQGSVLIGPHDFDALAGDMARCLVPALAADAVTSRPTDDESALAAELEHTRYSTTEWNHAH